MQNVPLSRFYDGKTSSAKEVRVEILGSGLSLAIGREIVAQWPLSDVFVKEDWVDGIGAVLGLLRSPDASLAVADRRLFLSIQSRLHKNRQASFLISTRYRTLLALTVLAIAAVWTLFPLVSHLASFVTYLVPDKVEQKLGETALDAMKKEFYPCDDPVARQSLERVVARLVPPEEKPPRIYFFRTATANAYTLPGHRMAILTGFLRDAKSEAELAGVLAHEVGHMVKRDPLEAFIEAQGFSTIMGLAGSSGSYNEVSQMVAAIQALKYSREKEFAADLYAVEALHRAGYSADGLVTFFSRMDAEDQHELKMTLPSLEILSTHPETQERIRRIRQAEKESPMTGQRKTSLSGAEFQRLKEACSVTKSAKN